MGSCTFFRLRPARWIDQNRDLLKPPVGNKLLFEDSEFIVMAVGGPNAARISPRSGSGILLPDRRRHGAQDHSVGPDDRCTIRAGEIFLLPSEVAHSPQRPAGSVGIVVERRRGPDELDGFSWYCENCGNCLYLERVAVQDIVTQLPASSRDFSRASSAAPARCAARFCRRRLRADRAPPEFPSRIEPGGCGGARCARPLNTLSSEFHHPHDRAGRRLTYLCGHSLGLQHESTESYVGQELADWRRSRSWAPRRRAPLDPVSRARGRGLASLVGAGPPKWWR